MVGLTYERPCCALPRSVRITCSPDFGLKQHNRSPCLPCLPSLAGLLVPLLRSPGLSGSLSGRTSKPGRKSIPRASATPFPHASIQAPLPGISLVSVPRWGRPLENVFLALLSKHPRVLRIAVRPLQPQFATSSRVIETRQGFTKLEPPRALFGAHTTIGNPWLSIIRRAF